MLTISHPLQREDGFSPTMSLTIDELRWLYLSSALDSLNLPSGQSSPSLCGDQQRKLSQSLTVSALSKNGDNLELLGFDGPFHFRSTSAPTPMPKSSSLTSPRVLTSSPPRSAPDPLVKGRPRRSRSPTTPCGSAPMSSPSQEWIYRRPNKKAGYCKAPLSTSSPTGGSHRHFNDENHPRSYSQLGASFADQGAVPFWSTLLRPRSRLERSISLLKAQPSRAQLVISEPFPPPAISSTTFDSDDLYPSPMLPPSIISTASTTSTISRPNTPIAPSFSFTTQHPRRTNLSRRSQHANLPVSSSCPPCKSILARSSSMSTRASHVTPTSPCSPGKAVKFVETPTVHYASPKYWDLESLEEGRATQCLPDIQMGIDVESMDLSSDDLGHNQKRGSYELEVARGTCATPTPRTQRENTNGPKRIMSLNRKVLGVAKNDTNCWSALCHRPSISRPGALGAFHTTTNSTSSSHHSPSHQTKSTVPTSTTVTRLRIAPSFESVKSTRSAGARSVRSLDSIKSTGSLRGFRAWLEKFRFASITRMNSGAG